MPQSVTTDPPVDVTFPPLFAVVIVIAVMAVVVNTGSGLAGVSFFLLQLTVIIKRIPENSTL
jgi:hypothetical protein